MLGVSASAWVGEGKLAFYQRLSNEPQEIRHDRNTIAL